MRQFASSFIIISVDLHALSFIHFGIVHPLSRKGSGCCSDGVMVQSIRSKEVGRDVESPLCLQRLRGNVDKGKDPSFHLDQQLLLSSDYLIVTMMQTASQFQMPKGNRKESMRCV
jgi:hypothetical protein